MAKSVSSDDPRRRPPEQGRSEVARPDAARGGMDSLVQRARDRRVEIERLLAEENWNAAAPLLKGLAKLPHDSTKDISFWARQQLQRIRDLVEPTTGDTVEVPAPPPPPIPPAPPTSPTAVAPESTPRPPVAGQSPRWLMPVLTAGIALVAFLAGLAASTTIGRLSESALRFEVDKSAANSDLGIGIGGRHVPAESLTEPWPLPPGQHSVSLTAQRIEVATLPVSIEKGAKPVVRLTVQNGAPRLELLDADGGPIAVSRPVVPAR